MGKILLVLIAALGAGLYFPQSREVILETAAPLADPAFRWMTNQEMSRIIDDLERDLETGGSLPQGRGEFDEWLDDRYPEERRRSDAWGTRYHLEADGMEFRVISAGPDEELGTEADLVAEGARER